MGDEEAGVQIPMLSEGNTDRTVSIYVHVLRLAQSTMNRWVVRGSTLLQKPSNMVPKVRRFGNSNENGGSGSRMVENGVHLFMDLGGKWSHLYSATTLISRCHSWAFLPGSAAFECFLGTPQTPKT